MQLPPRTITHEAFFFAIFDIGYSSSFDGFPYSYSWQEVHSNLDAPEDKTVAFLVRR
jgi:hypothetical protein